MLPHNKLPHARHRGSALSDTAQRYTARTKIWMKNSKTMEK